MFKGKTVFIVGAGASAEVGLPIGADLKFQIIRELQQALDKVGGYDTRSPTTQVLENWVRGSRFSEVELGRAVESVCQGLRVAYSIDNFLEARNGSEAILACAKLGITAAILKAESSSQLLMQSPLKSEVRLHDKVESTWYRHLADKLFSGVHESKVEKLFENVAFVIFNYDRCIETYLKAALKAYYQLNDSVIEKILQGAIFLHPYGSIGSPLLSDGSKNFISFGDAKPRPDRLAESAENLRTFCEQVDDVNGQGSLQAALSGASTVVFLGFAFHDQNMQLLHCDTSSVKRVFGTAYQISEDDREVVESRIRNALKIDLNHKVKLADATCSELFERFSRSIG